jgi:NAD(P)-dependent dehydrogenase (short-subunit alcohol dehydrogenase family)
MDAQQKYMNKLQGARVLVIGGSSGLGFGVAEAVLECGASKVIVSSSNESRVQAAVAKLKKSSLHSKAEILGHACNLGNEATLESNIKALFSKVGELDHIVFSAGDSLAIKPLEDIDFAFVKQAGMVRFFAPLLVAKHGSKVLPRSTTSTITLTSGGISEHPSPDWTVVAAYMTGVHGMTRNLALDLKPIRVNVINPGGVVTELWDSIPGEQRGLLMEEMAKKCATGSVGLVEDVVEAYLYCMRDKNVTGSVINSNGGYLLM